MFVKWSMIGFESYNIVSMKVQVGMAMDKVFIFIFFFLNLNLFRILLSKPVLNLITKFIRNSKPIPFKIDISTGYPTCPIELYYEIENFGAKKKFFRSKIF